MCARGLRIKCCGIIKNNKMGGELITKNIYQIYLNFSQEHNTI